MRVRLTWVLFALGVLAAGCGGGGGSKGVIPASGGGISTTNAPSTARTTHASISIYVPAANKQASRKPFYISPNTQAFGVLVLPYTSPLPSPVPSTGLQMFPVATPSPCAVASAGGYQCTFTVTAPVGNDIFIVAAFAQVTPSPGVGPLSAFVSGEVNVSLSPAPSASPFAFTLNGVVDRVAVAVASPDPGNTPNTQVFTVGAPTSAPIGITAYDSSGNVIMSPASLPYYSPIVIQASPASAGLTFALIGASVCGSSASGATATINCAGDLNDVQVTYDGTPRPDASDHLIDSFSVYSTTAPNPTPSPANFVLQSNEISTTLSSGATIGSPGYMRRLQNGRFAYVVYNNTAFAYVNGTFDPATGTAGAQTQLTDTNSFGSIAFLPDGSYWVLDNNGGIGNTLECFSSLTATAPTVTGVVPTESYDGSAVSVSSIGADGNGDLWYTGWDENYQGGGPPAPPSFAGFFRSSGCANPNPSVLVAQFTLTNGYGDSNPNLMIAVNSSGMAAVASESIYLLSNPYNGVWLMNTSTAPGAVAGGQTLNAGAYGTAIAVDDAGNGFATFTGGANPDDIERMPSTTTTLNEVLAVPPSASGSYPSPGPAALHVFSATGGAADRAMYIDQTYAALALVENIATTPLPLLVSLPGSVFPIDAAYSANGGEYVLDMDATPNLNIVRILPTRTWWVPNVTMNAACNSSGLLTILERGDSGPFTVTATNSVVVTPVTGADHDFWLTSLTSGTPFSATVTDAHGRSESFNITATSSTITCGITHRRLIKKKP